MRVTTKTLRTICLILVNVAATTLTSCGKPAQEPLATAAFVPSFNADLLSSLGSSPQAQASSAAAWSLVSHLSVRDFAAAMLAELSDEKAQVDGIPVNGARQRFAAALARWPEASMNQSIAAVLANAGIKVGTAVAAPTLREVAQSVSTPSLALTTTYEGYPTYDFFKHSRCEEIQGAMDDYYRGQSGSKSLSYIHYINNKMSAAWGAQQTTKDVMAAQWSVVLDSVLLCGLEPYSKNPVDIPNGGAS